MGTITLGVDSAVEKRFRRSVKREYGEGKGKLGMAVTEAMKQWADEKEQKRIAEQELKILEKGFSMGKMLYRKREELYGR